MAKAVGIGGIFLHFKGEEQELFKWYKENLLLDMSNYGTGFIEGEQLLLLSFKRHNETDPYINLRVDDISTIIQNFKDQGLSIPMEIADYDYGKFAQFEDPFGNIVELWEPNVENYKKMVLAEIEKFNNTK